MPDNVTYLLLATAVMFAVTFLLRAFPFLAFGNRKEIPSVILYIGKVISPSVMAVLLVYCLKDTNVTAAPYGLGELLALATCIVLHKLLHNPLFSIIGSTAVYMTIIQLTAAN